MAHKYIYRRPFATEAVDNAARQAKMKAFLDTFAVCGNIKLACEAAGINRNTYYHWMDNSDDETGIGDNRPEYAVVLGDGTSIPFAAAVKVAAEEAADLLEAEVRRRAVDGWEEPVYGTLGTPEIVEGKNGQEREVVRTYTGQVGTVKKFSDNLLMFLLKKNRPEFRDNHRVDVQVNNQVTVTDSARERLAEKLLAAIERREAQGQARVFDDPGKGAAPGLPEPGLAALPAASQEAEPVIIDVTPGRNERNP
jgi:hypothetical protein